MNREIKFRIWKEEHQEFFYFDLSQNPKYWIDKLKDDKLQQYTGLKDKNNTEIYEGDIVLYGKNKKQVTFRTGSWGLDNLNEETCAGREINKHYSLYLESKDYEIIGNIHDNAELLS